MHHQRRRHQDRLGIKAPATRQTPAVLRSLDPGVVPLDEMLPNEVLRPCDELSCPLPAGGSHEPRTAALVGSLLVFLASGVPAHASGRWFPVGSEADFADVRAQLQVVVDEHAHRAENRFCVVGQRTGTEEEAWVCWRQENKLILWLPDKDNPHAIAGSKRTLDLTRDVVAGNDVHGSTYLMTRRTVDEKIRACRQHGETYLIEKSAGEAAHG